MIKGAPWECPNCQTANLSAARSCEVCGEERVTRAATVDPEAGRCSALTRNRRCYMAGSIGTKSAHCTWHSFDPRHVESLDEFERWITGLREQKYCATWTHYPVAALWDAVGGTAPLTGDASPCLRAGCEHRPTPTERLDWRAAIAAATLPAPPRRETGAERVGAVVERLIPESTR